MLPLQGITVVEIAQNLAGPIAAEILAHLGAEVIKVERPEGDDARRWGPPFWKGVSPGFLAVNANKRSITLDLKEPADVEWLADFIGRADVLVQNLRPGSLEGLGLGAETLRARYPRLVYCSVWAFGSTGPLRLQPGYEPLVRGRLALRDGPRLAQGPLRVLPHLGRGARAPQDGQPAGRAVPELRDEDGAAHHRRGQRPAVRQARRGPGPPRMGGGPALRDQRRARRQQARSLARDRGHPQDALEGRVDRPPRGGRRALRAHPHPAGGRGAAAGRRHRDDPARARRRLRAGGPAAVLRRRSAGDPPRAAQARRAHPRDPRRLTRARPAKWLPLPRRGRGL